MTAGLPVTGETRVIRPTSLVSPQLKPFPQPSDRLLLDDLGLLTYPKAVRGMLQLDQSMRSAGSGSQHLGVPDWNRSVRPAVYNE